MLAPLLVAVIALLGPYLYTKLRYIRLKQFARFPQLLPSAVFGHLAVLDEFIKRSPPNAHPDMALKAMHKTLGQPPVMFVDLRPVSPPMLVVGSHDVAEQIVRTSSPFPHSPPKAPEAWKYLEHLTGPTAIVASRGETWKALRKRFNPGFAPQHLMSLLPAILDTSFLFLDHLDNLAQSGEHFSLQRLATNLTFDIIGRVGLDIDMGAQGDNPTEFMRVFHDLITTYADEQAMLPWWLTPRLEWKRQCLSKHARRLLKSIIRQRHAELDQASKSRSILSMSLQGIDSLTPETVNVTCDQLTTFLFAGHDTTSTTISWAFYELSRTPHALRAVRAELDALLGPDPSPAAVRARLTSPGGEELIHRMTYTTAVLKEVLRLWPPGGTARTTKPGDGLTVALPTGETMNVDGLMVYPVHSIIQRDAAVFGDSADVFVPERWLDQEASSKIPVGAWRAFERGPRSCIGQELAMIEARVTLALTARRYDFTKVGIGAAVMRGGSQGVPEVGEHGQYEVAE